MSTEQPRVRAPGWRDFDPEVVEGLAENDPRFIDRRPGGWIACPLLGHYVEELPWRDDNYKKGSAPHGDPRASFRASPTYVLDDPLDNVIAGRELIAEAGSGRWGNLGSGRLGNEHSEEALTWNVFRSLQEAGRLGVAAHALAGIEAAREPEPIVWGRKIGDHETSAWPKLQPVLELLEPGGGRQSEPDVCLHLEGWGWLVVVAGFGSGGETYEDAARVEAWLARYATACPGLFDAEAIRALKPKTFPHAVLRNVAFAHSLLVAGEQAAVVALVRESDATDVERWVGRCLADGVDVAFNRATWEDLYRALDPDEPGLRLLRAYLENKSYGLRQALAV